MKAYVNSKIIGNWCKVFAWAEEIIPESNDWLSLISDKTYSVKPKDLIHNELKRVRDKPPSLVLTEPHIFGMNAFFRGTVHGYAFIFQMIYQYKDSNLKVLLAADSQEGIKNICIKCINPDRIVYVNSDTIIECPQFHFVRNVYHDLVPLDIMNCVVPLFIRPAPALSIAVFKTATSQNVTNCGILSETEIDDIQLPKRFQRTYPERLSESEWASMVYNSKELVLPWNSCYFKAIMYLTQGHTCRSLHVLIIGDEFKRQYTNALTNQRVLNYAPVQTVFHIYPVVLDTI